MTRYQKGKEKLRNQAMEWQLDFDNHKYSYLELSQWCEYFSIQAKRYRLIKEFIENGII